MKFYIEEIICFVVAFGFWIYSLVLLLNGSNMDTGLTEAVIAGSVTLVVAVVTGTVAIYRASKSTDSKLGKAEGTLSKEHTELKGDLKLGNSEIIGNLSNKHTELKGDLSKLAIVSDDVKSSVGRISDTVLEEKLKREALHSMFTSREHDINETMKEFSEFMADWEGKINENAKLKQDKLILEGKNIDLREKLSGVDEKISALSSEISAVRNENIKLQEEIADVRTISDKLREEATNSMQLFAAEKSLWESQNTELITELNGLRAQSEEYEAEL